MGEVTSIIGPRRSDPPPVADGNGHELSVFEQELVGQLVASKLRGVEESKLRYFTDAVLARLCKLFLNDVPVGRDAQTRALLAHTQNTGKKPSVPTPTPTASSPSTTPPPSPPRSITTRSIAAPSPVPESEPILESARTTQRITKRMLTPLIHAPKDQKDQTLNSFVPVCKYDSKKNEN